MLCDKKAMKKKCRLLSKRPNSPFYAGMAGMVGFGLVMMVYSIEADSEHLNHYFLHRNKQVMTFFGFYAIGELFGRALRFGYKKMYPTKRPKAVHVANLPVLDKDKPVGNYIVSSTLSDYFSEPTDFFRRYRMPFFMGVGFAGLFGLVAFFCWVHSRLHEDFSPNALFVSLTDSIGACAFFTCLNWYSWFNIPTHAVSATISCIRSRQENIQSFGHEPVLPYDSDIFDTDRMRTFSPTSPSPSMSRL